MVCNVVFEEGTPCRTSDSADNIRDTDSEFMHVPPDPMPMTNTDSQQCPEGADNKLKLIALEMMDVPIHNAPNDIPDLPVHKKPVIMPEVLVVPVPPVLTQWSAQNTAPSHALIRSREFEENEQHA